MLGMAIRKWWVKLTRESPMDAIVNSALPRHKWRRPSMSNPDSAAPPLIAASSSAPEVPMSAPLPHPRPTRVAAALALIASLSAAPQASAFCGFYVGKADAKLFNEASQVILARDGNRTVIGMRNDFQGELTDF